MSKFSVPGVYVEEMKGLSLAINSSETAIPMIVASDDDFKTLESRASVHYVTVDSWLAATSYAGTASDKMQATMMGRSLQAYFTNGGGRAYVCRQSKLASSALELSDATLLVQAGATLSAADITGICKNGSGVFGVLDAKDVELDSDDAAHTDVAENDNVALYYPWFKGATSSGSVAPSAIMAGIYAKVDADRGVWKAPANVAVQGYVPKYDVADAQQAGLNDAATPINIIRRFPKSAPLVWGARTGKNGSAFLYVPVRRLFNALERDIKKAMSQAVFEPNASATWEKVRAAIDNYLYGIWRRGGLAGEKPEEAYRVLIGEGVTMNASEIELGQMIVEVAVAPSRPAEFVLLRFSEKMHGA